ncbi:MAG: hypothetical protein ACRC7N_00095 [Clostridium sp.]
MKLKNLKSEVTNSIAKLCENCTETTPEVYSFLWFGYEIKFTDDECETEN